VESEASSWTSHVRRHEDCRRDKRVTVEPVEGVIGMPNEMVALLRLHEMEFPPTDEMTQTRERTEVETRRCRSEMTPGLLARYEQLKKRYGAGALVEVENGTCSGCRVVLARRLLARLRNDPAFCDHCGRILYDPDCVYHFQY